MGNHLGPFSEASNWPKGWEQPGQAELLHEELHHLLRPSTTILRHHTDVFVLLYHVYTCVHMVYTCVHMVHKCVHMVQQYKHMCTHGAHMVHMCTMCTHVYHVYTCVHHTHGVAHGTHDVHMVYTWCTVLPRIVYRETLIETKRISKTHFSTLMTCHYSWGN